MYLKPNFRKTSVSRNEATEGSSIEEKIERIVNNKEAITDGAPIIFTERNEGVLAAYNIRTDRFEIAIDGMDRVQKSYQAKRDEKANLKVVESSEKEPAQASENQANS